MRQPPALLLALLLFSGSATAGGDASPDLRAAAHFLDDYYAAVRRHDLATVTAMIADDATIVVTLDNDSTKHFTLGKAGFLQQLRATWHFASAESYSVGPVTWHAEGTRLQAVLQESESRVLLGTATLQRNDIALELAASGPSLRIVAMHVRTTFR